METEELFESVYSRFKMHFYREVFGKFASREATLTTVETFCMEVIHAMGRPTINEFAHFIRLTSPNAAYKINNLVKKGYLNKVQSSEDKRVYYLEPTQKYRDYYAISSSYVNQIMKQVREKMTESEWDGFRRSLEIIWEEQEADMGTQR